MSTKTEVNTLWQELRAAINAAYEATQKTPQCSYCGSDVRSCSTHENSVANKQAKQDLDDGQCLRDYAENISWSDDLAALLGRESANERQHRRNRPSPAGFSIETASKLILLRNAADGASMPDMPRATIFLVLRKTAAEMEVIGYLARKHLSKEWRDRVQKMDYSELMKVS